jgi:hypothetical protein
MATGQRREHDEQPKLTKAEHLRRADEALARAEEHRKRFFEALERLRRVALR